MVWIWIQDNVAVLALLASILAGGLALLQWRKQVSIRRTEFAYQIMDKLRYNREIAQTHYLIEYGEFHYDERFHDNHDLEQKIDELLSILNYACYLLASRAIAKKDFSIFKYKVAWILMDTDIQAYLWNLYHFSKHNQAPCSFQYLINWGLKEELLPYDFRTPYYKKFVKRKYLNF